MVCGVGPYGCRTYYDYWLTRYFHFFLRYFDFLDSQDAVSSTEGSGPVSRSRRDGSSGGSGRFKFTYYLSSVNFRN